MGPRRCNGNSTLCFLFFALPFLRQSYSLLSRLVLVAWVVLWSIAATVQVVQRARAACSASASFLLVFLACPLLEPKNYDVSHLRY